MLSHRAIWDGIDALARRHGHSVSALAKLAGLDATAFNVSKRVSKDGRERWPSTESISKILEATGESFDSFLSGTGAFLQLNDNLPNRTEDEDLAHAVSLIRRHGAVEATRERARHFAERACDALSIFPDGRARAAMVEAARFAVSRGY